MKSISLAVVKNDLGEKVLDVSVYGVIDNGFADGVDASQIARDLLANKDAKAITVHINSMGGSMFDGIAIHNLLKSHGAPVTSIVEGWAASAASIVAMTGKTVMGAGAMMLIHNPWTIAMGDATELRRVAADLDKARDSLITIYRQKTGKDAAELRAMLAAETLMTAEQAMRQGFADEIHRDSADAAQPQDNGDDVIYRAVAFPKERLAPQFMALLSKETQMKIKSQTDEPEVADPPKEEPAKEPEAEKPAEEPEKDPEPPSGAPSSKAGKNITRAELFELAPEAMASALADARAAGVKEERQRIREIFDLGLKGCDEMVKNAMFESPVDVRDLAVAAIKAGKQAGADLLEAMRSESKEAASVRQSAPEKRSHEQEEQAIRAMVQGGDIRRGGSR